MSSPSKINRVTFHLPFLKVLDQALKASGDVQDAAWLASLFYDRWFDVHGVSVFVGADGYTVLGAYIQTLNPATESIEVRRHSIRYLIGHLSLSITQSVLRMNPMENEPARAYLPIGLEQQPLKTVENALVLYSYYLEAGVTSSQAPIASARYGGRIFL